MYDFLVAVGGFALVLCAVVVILFPALLAVVLGAKWLWLYAFYFVVLLVYASVVARSRADDKGEATREKKDEDEE